MPARLSARPQTSPSTLEPPSLGLGDFVEQPQDLHAERRVRNSKASKNLIGDALFYAAKCEQEVLGADVVVTQRARLAECKLECFLRARSEAKPPHFGHARALRTPPPAALG